MNKIKEITFTLFLFWNLVFFSICSILGVHYDESSTPIYLYGVILISAFAFVLIGFKGLNETLKFPLYTLIFPVIILLEYIVESIVFDFDMFQYLKYYLGFGIPASIIGSYLAQNGGIQSLSKWVDVVMIIITIGLVYSIPAIVFSSTISLGGASYQQMAYMAAVAFLMNLTGILYGDNYNRFKIFNRRLFRWFAMFFLILQLIACFFAGGRGGFILLVAGSIALLAYKHKLNYITYIVVFFLALYAVSTMYKGTIFYEVIGTRMERTFSFISDNGTIDTQNRGEVWEDGFDYYNNNGSSGNGLFNYYHFFRARYDQPYAHNIFLDMLCQGGILYLIIWIILLSRFFINTYKIIHKNSNQVLLIPIVLYMFIQLLFSSTYLNSSLFWFALSYVHTVYHNPKVLRI